MADNTNSVAAPQANTAPGPTQKSPAAPTTAHAQAGARVQTPTTLNPIGNPIPPGTLTPAGNPPNRPGRRTRPGIPALHLTATNARGSIRPL